jgi:hypothetical protein
LLYSFCDVCQLGLDTVNSQLSVQDRIRVSGIIETLHNPQVPF